MRAQTGTRRGTEFHCLDKKSSLWHDRNEHAEDIVIEPLPVNNRTSGFSTSRQAFASHESTVARDQFRCNADAAGAGVLQRLTRRCHDVLQHRPVEKTDLARRFEEHRYH